ncbi:MAG: M28 family peptidase, partial [bacterium]
MSESSTQDLLLFQKAKEYLNKLCSVKPNRRVGSQGNRAATDFFAQTIESWGYTIDTTPFDCLDYEYAETSLVHTHHSFEIYISPYSLGCDVTAELVTVSTVEELEKCECRGKILLMKDAICAEPLMPKNFVFYNPDHHKKIYALLEEKQPAAIITATEKNPHLVGAIDPFPVIEDGDFDIPSIYCKKGTGIEIARRTGEAFHLRIDAKRIAATACNVIARKNQKAHKKIIVSAHIDARENTPGASDNASGIVVELLLGEMLANYSGNLGVEIIAFNGEDHYSVAGQMDYLARYGKYAKDALVAINIDDVGYHHGRTAYSFYGCPAVISRKLHDAFRDNGEVVEGEPWYQGDHMIFVQNEVPAIALTSENMAELMASITHSEKDTPEIIDC